jgi:hypothetical protein
MKLDTCHSGVRSFFRASRLAGISLPPLPEVAHWRFD